MAAKTDGFTATYDSPTNEKFSVVHNLEAPSKDSTVESKSKYLQNLRQAVRATQERVNQELTARMEEDKVRETGSGAKSASDEAKEEENYGEENVEEDE